MGTEVKRTLEEQRRVLETQDTKVSSCMGVCVRVDPKQHAVHSHIHGVHKKGKTIYAHAHAAIAVSLEQDHVLDLAGRGSRV